MNQYKQLVKRTTKLAVSALIVVGVCAGVYMAIYMVGERVATQKTEAESKLSEESARLNTLRSQMEKSGQAEQKYSVIMEDRQSQEFAMNQDKLTDWLKSAAMTYRLNTLKVTRTPELETAKPELKAMNYRISLRQPIKLEFLAVSDLHVFSFMDAMMKSAPGLIVINNVQLKRRNDIRPDVLTNLRNGVTPLLVEAKVEFVWIGITPKSDGASHTDAATPNSAPGTQPLPPIGGN